MNHILVFCSGWLRTLSGGTSLLSAVTSQCDRFSSCLWHTGARHWVHPQKYLFFLCQLMLSFHINPKPKKTWSRTQKPKKTCSWTQSMYCDLTIITHKSFISCDKSMWSLLILWHVGTRRGVHPQSAILNPKHALCSHNYHTQVFYFQLWQVNAIPSYLVTYQY
jgi:hypothetical protein